MSRGIQAIDGESVHRIHSGQVVLDLQGALKELVENALDAGATSIEVRIRDNGLSAIEVSDNGSGIAQADWPSIGLKHHTSKLPSLELLHSVNTFGFRGEALSALCALCESVTVTTATTDMEPLGAVITLGRDGSVVEDTARVARPRGTTITLSGLFAPLPVRRKEFERNAKRELSKALTLLTAYALLPASASSARDRSGVRLKVESITGGNASGKGGKRSTLLSNDGRGDLRAGVVGVWGTKALDGVQDMNLAFDVPLDRMAQRVGVQTTAMTQVPASTYAVDAVARGTEGEGETQEAGALPAATLQVKVVGLVSSASWGLGRSSADRQYFFINGRPVDAKPLQKALNEVYKGFNTHQVPLAVLDFQIPKASIDINVSPDKRTILLHSESNLIAAFRSALEAFFEPSRSNFAVNGATQTVRGLKVTQSTLSLGARPGAVGSPGEPAVLETDHAVDNDLAEDDDTASRHKRRRLQDHDATSDVTSQESPFRLVTSASKASTTTKAEGEVQQEAEEEIDSEAELERFDASPVVRRPAQYLETRTSRPVRRTSNDPITVLDEDEEEGDDDTGNLATDDHEGAAVGGVDVTDFEPAVSGRTDRVSRMGSLSSRREAGSATISTSTASWNPAVKCAASQSARHQPPSRSSTPRASGSTQAKTGREARKSLRERLAVYSQLPSGSQRVEADDSDDIAGGDAAEIGCEVGRAVSVEEEGEEELESDNESTGDRDVIPSIDTKRARNRAPQQTEPKSGALEEDEEGTVSEPRERLAIDEDSEDENMLGNQIGETGEAAWGQEEAEDREKVRADPDINTDVTVISPRTSDAAQDMRRYRDEIITAASTGSMTIPFSLPAVRARAAKRQRISHAADTDLAERQRGRTDLAARLGQAGVAADAGIANRDLTSAEAALSRTVSRDDFGRMEVIGQFNKGFVIARCRSDAHAEGKDYGQDDLYIVDQHASDEKFNFETLQKETRIKAQKLIKPRGLQLTAADEIVAIENLDTLRANGFEVEIDEDQPPGRGERVKLVAMPVSKETVFDYRDLEQLLHLLSDSAHSASSSGYGQMVRCTKARAMFAMRACRKSIMIGKSLTKPQMTQLLRNMGTIEQPWNCPHGRPTMRHLTAIDSSTSNTGRQAIDWQRWSSEQDHE